MKLSKITISLFFLSLCMVSCVTKDFEDNSENPTGQSLNESTFFSEGSFSGIDLITNITDTSVIVSWKESTDAEEYLIYDVSKKTPILVDKVSAPATSIQLNKLKSGTLYGFQVRIKDNLGLLDNNEVIKYGMTHTFPEPPSFLVKAAPEKFNDILKTPSILVYGVIPGDIVSLYTDPACSIKVAEGKTNHSFIKLTTKVLTSGSTYTFYASRKNINGVSSACSVSSASYNLLTCPDGYVAISDNNGLGLDPFCVMKYEAKAWFDSDSDNIVDSVEVDTRGCKENSCTSKNWGVGIYTPGSSPQGKPWRMLDAAHAKQACQGLGNGYDLISNKEWMTVAEEIEGNLLNWSGGAVGLGCIYQGNTGKSSVCSYSIANIDQGSSRDSKASQALKNGEIIWDISGNVAEWVDWGSELNITKVPISCNDEWSENSTDFCSGNLLDIEYRPFNPAGISSDLYNSTFGIGQIEGGVGGYVVRGGAYLYGDYAGIYSMSLAQNLDTAREEIGFRCVYRIPID